MLKQPHQTLLSGYVTCHDSELFSPITHLDLDLLLLSVGATNISSIQHTASVVMCSVLMPSRLSSALKAILRGTLVSCMNPSNCPSLFVQTNSLTHSCILGWYRCLPGCMLVLLSQTCCWYRCL